MQDNTGKWKDLMSAIQALIMFHDIIAVCIHRCVITFGIRSKYDVLGHYFIFMIVLPSINKFNMT